MIIKKRTINRRGYSLSSWTEVALMVTLFSLLFIAIIAEMNVKYGKNYDGAFGLGGESSGVLGNTKGNISDYQNTLQQSVSQGEASSSGLGIGLTTTWGIISAGASIMWNFLTGGYIEQLAIMAHFPPIVATFLRILFVISIGFVILRLVLKLSP